MGVCAGMVHEVAEKGMGREELEHTKGGSVEEGG